MAGKSKLIKKGVITPEEGKGYFIKKGNLHEFELNKPKKKGKRK